MLRQNSNPIRVMVTGGGALLGQGILRALKNSTLNVYTIAVDVSPLSAGLFWANESFLVPSANSPAYIDAIRSVLDRTRPDIMFVGTDVELAPLALERDALERQFGTRVMVSSPEVVEICNNKYSTFIFFRKHGFPAPKSALVSNKDDVERLIAECGFPLVVKPCIGARSYGVGVAHNRSDLDKLMMLVERGVVQECVGDDKHEYTASGLYFDGRCDATVVMRRDLRDGNTYRAFTVHDLNMDRLVKKWTEALKPFGPANFQFRIDNFGVAKVFEINGRFSGTTPLRAHAGFNEVEMCIRKVLWNEPIIQPEIRPVTILRHWSETVVSPNSVEIIEQA